MNNPDNSEWIKFQRDIHRFDDNPPEQRYGIINPVITNMLYAPNLADLRRLHIANWPLKPHH